jgi:hypothetical protein
MVSLYGMLLWTWQRPNIFNGINQYVWHDCHCPSNLRSQGQGLAEPHPCSDAPFTPGLQDHCVILTLSWPWAQASCRKHFASQNTSDGSVLTVLGSAMCIQMQSKHLTQNLKNHMPCWHLRALRYYCFPTSFPWLTLERTDFMTFFVFLDKIFV